MAMKSVTSRMLCLCLWAFCGLHCLQAQTPLYDSLIVGIDSLPNDTNKVRAYLKAFKPLLFPEGEGAMHMTEHAVALARELQYPKGEAEATRLQGIYYMVNGASDLALQHYQRAFEMFKQMGDQHALVLSANNFATLYMELEEWDSAMTYLSLRKGFRATSASDSVMLGTMIHNEAICQDMKGRHAEAYAIFEQNLRFFEQMGALYEQSFTAISMGETAVKLGKAQEALVHLRHAQSLKEQLGDQRGVANAQIQMALAYSQLGEHDSALVVGQRGLELAGTNGYGDIWGDGHRYLAQVHAARGDYPKATALLLRYVEIDDSLTRVANHSKLMGLQAAYGLKNKNDEIRELQHEMALDAANGQRQQILIIALVAGIVVVLVIAVILYRAGAARARLHEVVSAKNQALQATNEALQGSIHERESLLHMVIHDLKSPLNSTIAVVDAMREIEDVPALAQRMMGKVEVTNRRAMALITDLLALYEMETQDRVATAPVSCKQLVEQLMTSMENLAQQKGIALVDASPALGCVVDTNASMAIRILENYVSNALKFSPKGTQVRIGFEQQGDAVVFFVQDEGPGVSQEDQARMFQKFMKLTARPTGGEHSNGLGLAIVKKLAERLHAQVGVQSELRKGARFWLSLPLVKE